MVGSPVQLNVGVPANREWLETLLGDTFADTIDLIQDSRPHTAEVPTSIAGTVHSIDAVFCRYDSDGQPVAGFNVVIPVLMVNRSAHYPPSRLELAGYLLSIDELCPPSAHKQ